MLDSTKKTMGHIAQLSSSYNQKTLFKENIEDCIIKMREKSV